MYSTVFWSIHGGTVDSTLTVHLQFVPALLHLDLLKLYDYFSILLLIRFAKRRSKFPWEKSSDVKNCVLKHILMRENHLYRWPCLIDLITHHYDKVKQRSIVTPFSVLLQGVSENTANIDDFLCFETYDIKEIAQLIDNLTNF